MRIVGIGAGFAATLFAAPVLAQVGPPPPPLAPLSAMPVPAGNPQSEAKIRLGQALFWDEQLSRTGSIACGSCHAPQAGGSDPRVQRDAALARHPGADGEFGSDDDALGATGVPRHDAEGRHLGSGVFGMAPQPGNRQAPSAINAGFSPLLFWDGRAGGRFDDPVSGALLQAAGAALENQALGPLVNDIEMAHVGGELSDMQARIVAARPLRFAASLPEDLASWIAGRDYPALFADVFGDGAVSAARIAFAIASYERSLLADQTPLDLELRGTPALTELEHQGRQVFDQVGGCLRCHNGALLSDESFHYLGVRPQQADPGRFAVTGQNADRGRMRTPGLRNLELSAPYMADGRFATLEEVVDFYDRGGDFEASNKAPQMTPLNLSGQQKAALLAFLRRPLTDPRLLAASGPFERPQLHAESHAAARAEGAGIAGNGGRVPRLFALEPPRAGASDFSVGVDGGLGGAELRLLLSRSAPATVDSPALLSLVATLTGEGLAGVEMGLPADPDLAGETLWLRAFVADPVAPGGWSASVPLRLQLLEVRGSDLFSNGFEASSTP